MSIKTVNKHGTIRYNNEKGELHREDGPAVEQPDGDKAWCLNDKDLTKQDWEKEILKIRLHRIIEL